MFYPPGFDGVTILSDGLGNNGTIHYLDAELNWKVPLRPHLGLLAVMPANTDNYANNRDDENIEGANSIPPSQFGGNVDDWRIGKGATMYLRVEVDGARLVVGDTHAAQGDSELAGTAMETSLTAQLKVTLHKNGSLPTLVQDLNFPLLETDDSFVIHGFAFPNYLDDLDTPSAIFAEGSSIDLALEDCFNKTRSFLINVYDMLEAESIAFMSTAVDFAITQVVDGNWGVHATVPKWALDPTDTSLYDYSCTPNPGGFSRRLSDDDRARKLEDLELPEDAAHRLFERVTKVDDDHFAPSYFLLERKLIDAKLFAANRFLGTDHIPNRIKQALEAKGTLVPIGAQVENKLEAAIDKAAADHDIPLP